jgi:hypothetical protein
MKKSTHVLSDSPENLGMLGSRAQIGGCQRVPRGKARRKLGVSRLQVIRDMYLRALKRAAEGQALQE